MKKCLKNIFQGLVILGALPMLFVLYGIFYKSVAETYTDVNTKEHEHKFYNVIVKKCIIVYYVAIAIILIWKKN